MEIESRFFGAGIDAMYERIFAEWRYQYRQALNSPENQLELQATVDDLTELIDRHTDMGRQYNAPSLTNETDETDGLVVRRHFEVRGPSPRDNARQSYLLSSIGKLGEHLIFGRTYTMYEHGDARFTIAQKGFYAGSSAVWMRGVRLHDSSTSNVTQFDFDQLMDEAAALAVEIRGDTY